MSLKRRTAPVPPPAAFLGAYEQWRLGQAMFEELCRSEQRFRAVFENNAVPILLVAKGGRVARANQAACAFFARDRSRLESTTVFELTHPDDRALMGSRMRARRRGKAVPRILTKRYLCGNKGTKWARVILTFPAGGSDDGETIAIIEDLSSDLRFEMAVVRERDRIQDEISRELHDGVAQHLSGLSFLGRSLAFRVQDAPSEFISDFSRLVSGLDVLVKEVRSLSRRLNPLPSEVIAADQVLRAAAENAAAIYGLKTRVRTSGISLPWDERTRVQVYRILQEAISNSVRHAGVRRVTLSLSRSDSGGTRVRVGGSGGRPVRRGLREGQGLANIRFRARSISAAIRIENRRGRVEIILDWAP